MPLSGMAGLYVRCMFNSLRNCRTVLKNGCYHLTFPQFMRILVSLPPHQHLLHMVSLFNFSHFNRYIVVFHYGFNVQFSID